MPGLEGRKGLLLARFLIFYLSAQAGVDAELSGAPWSKSPMDNSAQGCGDEAPAYGSHCVFQRCSWS